MKFSLSWLQNHIAINQDFETLCNKLDNLGLEVDAYEDLAAKYNGFLVAEILEAEQHPNADSLRVCKVFNGEKILQIVCGATNARKGIKVVLAQVGALIPRGNFVIKNSKIRSVESQGMLCSEEELDLSQESEGILELPKHIPAGTLFSTYLGLQDYYLELAITPNRRKDAASVYGIARDLATAGLGKLKLHNDKITTYNSKPLYQVEIIAKDFCSDFTYFTVNNINQELLKTQMVVEEKLLTIIKAEKHNPLVNLSNFLLLDLGIPNHFYDLNKIQGKVEVTLSQGGEIFTALGGKEYTLPEGLLLVRDEEKILSLAGLMGGELSKVDENSQNILVEVANFKPDIISLASYKLNLTSNSSYIFISGCDYLGQSHKALAFLQQKFSSFQLSNITSLKGHTLTQVEQLEVSLQELTKYLGLEVAEDDFINIFTALHYQPKKLSNGRFLVTIPSWRQGNIESYQDLLEELLRMGFLDKINQSEKNTAFIKPKLVTDASLFLTKNNNAENFANPRLPMPSTANNLRDIMIARGFHEVMTWPFYSEEDEALFQIESDHKKYFSPVAGEDLVKIANPINKNFTIMRRSFLPNLMKVLTRYPNYLEKNFSIFELGNLYGKDYPQYQISHLAALRQGYLFKNNLTTKNRRWNFFDVREDLLALLVQFGLASDFNNYQYDQIVPSYYNPAQSIRVKLGGQILGFLGTLHPALATKLDLEAPALLECFLHNLPEKVYKKQQIKPFQPSPYQKIKRDLAFLVEESLIVGELVKSIKNLKEKLLESVEIFDLYKGIEGGKKSVGITLTIQPQVGNLTDHEIELIISKVVKVLEEKYQAKIRNK